MKSQQSHNHLFTQWLYGQSQCLPVGSPLRYGCLGAALSHHSFSVATVSPEVKLMQSRGGKTWASQAET